jgi:hypothetical protein
MDSWWELGEASGYDGTDLALWRINCPFCPARGNFEVEHHVEKKRPNGDKVLNYDTLRCGNCGNYAMVFWSAGEEAHDYRMVPWPRRWGKYPDHWPDDLGRFWLQAKRSLSMENWDAAAVMARSALQCALRSKEAAGKSLVHEIDDLAEKGLLAPIMREWSHELRVLGNESAHPAPGNPPISNQDARDVVRFLDYVLEYLFTLPHRIEQYRARKKPV